MQIWAVRSVEGPKDSVSNPSLALLAEHGFDDMGDRRQLDGFVLERGLHTGAGWGARLRRSATPCRPLIAVATSWPASANTDWRTSATLNSSSTTRMSA